MSANHSASSRERQHPRLTTVLATLLLLATATTLVRTVPAAAGTTVAQEEARLLELHNEARRAADLPALQRDAALDAIAREWSSRMVREDDFNHRPDVGAQIERRVTTRWRSWGENIALGLDADDIHRRFMNSSGHRRNILDDDYNRVGVGAHRDSRGVLWMTVDFLEGPDLANLPPTSSALPAPGSPQPAVPTPASAAVRMVSVDGVVTARGTARHFGNVAVRTGERIAAIASSPGGEGYWVATANGRVTAMGDAVNRGGVERLPLRRPIVGMAPTPSSRGYWLVASDGGIFGLGDARFYGSTGGIRLASPIVGMAATPSGQGYWMVAADGGVFAFGDARFYGSTGGLRLDAPIVGMAATPSGRGYWMVAVDGGLFGFGDARFRGSAAPHRLGRPVVSMVAAGDGYMVVADDGATMTFTSERVTQSPAARPSGSVISAH